MTIVPDDLETCGRDRQSGELVGDRPAERSWKLSST